jgi:hypothetical protein
MDRKHLAILATAGLVWSVSPAHAADGIGRLAASAKGDAANHDALQSQAKPTDVSAAKKKKGNGGKKGGEQQPYMTIKMENTMVTSYRSQGGRPKGAPGGGLLGTTSGNFNPNPPSPTGTPLAPPAGRGGVIR